MMNVIELMGYANSLLPTRVTHHIRYNVTCYIVHLQCIKNIKQNMCHIMCVLFLLDYNNNNNEESSFWQRSLYDELIHFNSSAFFNFNP